MAHSKLALGLIFSGLALYISACGAATPTVAPASPTAAAVVQPSPVVKPPTALPPQPTVAAPPTALATTVPLTPTVAAKTTVTATVVAQTTKAPAATKAATAPPKVAAPTGRIVYSVAPDPAPRLHGVYVANADGSGAHKILDYAMWASLSPNGKNVAFFQLPGGGKNEGLYVADAFGGNAVAVFISPGVCCTNWSRDGNWIVFVNSARPRQPGGPILMVKADGSYKTVIDLRVEGRGPSFSPDGKQIAYSGCLPGTSTCGIFAANADGSGAARAITRDNGGSPQWSPDGKRIVYQANDDANRTQVFVVNSDGSGKKQLTSGKSNDGQPVWSRDGGSIFWRSDQNGTAWAIFVMNADGSNPRRLIANVPPDADLWGWESLSAGP